MIPDSLYYSPQSGGIKNYNSLKITHGWLIDCELLPGTLISYGVTISPLKMPSCINHISGCDQYKP